ncbi:hypothetical protein MBH78_19530 [Oceanimonas sp. NS1]|nr:hypothetical protein [Oceanimonas sp. NS1]
MDILIMLVLTLVAGMAMPAGALLARVERIHPHWLENEFRHAVVAFGGGALLSAVALVLVPQGAARLQAGTAALCFAGGGLAFMALDMLLYRLKTQAGQLAAMLSDFIPESLALGAAFAFGSQGGALLLAGLMALQNLPEGFNAFRELNGDRGRRAGQAIRAFTPDGPAGAGGGPDWLFLVVGLPRAGVGHHAVRCRWHSLFGVSGYRSPGGTKASLGTAHGGGAGLFAGNHWAYAHRPWRLNSYRWQGSGKVNRQAEQYTAALLNTADTVIIQIRAEQNDAIEQAKNHLVGVEPSPFFGLFQHHIQLVIAAPTHGVMVTHHPMSLRIGHQVECKSAAMK